MFREEYRFFYLSSPSIMKVYQVTSASLLINIDALIFIQLMRQKDQVAP